MARLDKQRQAELEPKRLELAKRKIQSLGYKVTEKAGNTLMFDFKGSSIVYWPYSGWATGSTIKDGRGLKNLLKQIITENKELRDCSCGKPFIVHKKMYGGESGRGRCDCNECEVIIN